MAYFAVIPNPVMISKKLSDSEKLLYARLSSKLNEDGYCDLPDNKLAEIMNVSVNYLSSIECGRANMSLGKILELSKYLETDIANLLMFK